MPATLTTTPPTPRWRLDDAFHERRVQVLDQRTDEGHLLASVVEDDVGIGRGAAETVGRHDHGQITGVHLRHRRHFALREDLFQK